MIAAMSGATALVVILCVAVVLAWARLLLWQLRASVAARARGWRIAALLALQPVTAMLLFRTLVPPERAGGGSTLVVATAGAYRLIPVRNGERLVALPEAREVQGATRSPDLGSALRSYPGTSRIRVVGTGLERRDRDMAGRVSVAFAPPEVPRGLIGLEPPATTAPGAVFRAVTRTGGGIDGGAVELVDPAGRVVDRQPVGAGGETVLSGTARGAGTTLFDVRVRDGRNRIVAQAPVPLWTEAPPAARLLILAGAPNPEVKFLRRWAADAGVVSAARMAVGGGVALSDAAAGVTPASLARIDTVIADERAWAEMGAGARAAIGAAVRGGMGLVVRVTAPAPRGWQVLGLGVAGGGTVVPASLAASAPGEAALAARRGPGTRDVPDTVAGANDALPPLTRLGVTIGGRDAVPVARDAKGNVLAAWRPSGLGRVAVVTLQDSFALVTSGHADRHAEWWSAVVSAVARPGGGTPPTIDALPRTGERVAICGGGDRAVTAPDGGVVRVLANPASGSPPCAGFWPMTAGWHQLDGAGARAFYVYPADALPDVRAAERREATLRLVGERQAAAGSALPARGSRWPWFAGWLIAAGLLWWLERYRGGRGRAIPAP